MAHDHEIGAADRPWKPPTSPDLLDDGLLYMPRQNELLAALERDLARWHVRRLANRHGCPGRCEDPAHATDVAAGLEVLEELGLRRAG